MSAQAIFGAALKCSIMLTLFGFGMQARRDDLLYFVRRPRLLVQALFAMFVVMPVLAILMTKPFPFNSPVSIALIALSISPVPPLLPKKITKSSGESLNGLGLMVTAAVFSVAFVPLATYLIGRYMNRPLAMGPATVAKLILLSVISPLAAGLVFRRLAPALAGRIAASLVRAAGIVLLVGVVCILVFALPAAWSLVGNGTILAIAGFVVAGLFVGHIFGRGGPNERVALALATACRHPALAVAIAGANIPAEHRVFGAVLLYALVNAFFTIPYVAWQRKKLAEPARLAKSAS